MATGGPPASGAILSAEERYYLRLFRLSKVGSEAVRVTFDRLVPPSTLVNFLKKHEPTFRRHPKKVLGKFQLDTLFPIAPGVVVQSAQFDTTLIICVIRILKLLPTPLKGWNDLPNISEATKEANLARVKWYRNELGHNSLQTLSNHDYTTYKQDLENAINGLDSTGTLKTKIGQALSAVIITEDELNEIRQEIKRLKDEIIPRHIQDQHNSLINNWKKDEKLYSETHASKLIYNKCMKGNFVTITGNSGSGKTAIANHIAIKLQKQEYTIIPVDNVKEIKDYMDRSQRQVFVINDIVGKSVIDEIRLSELESVNDTIESLAKDTNIKVIVTCRKQVRADSRLKNTFVCKNTIDLHHEKHKLTREERKHILAKYTFNKPTKMLNDTSAILDAEYTNFPLLCKLFGANPRFQKKKDDFFKNMFSILASELEDIKAKDPVHFCALVLCMLHENSFNSEMLDPFSLDKAKKEITNIMEACKVPRDKTFHDIRSSMEKSVDVYLVQEHDSFRFIHDALYEATAYLFGKDYPCELLKYCSSSFIGERICIENTERSDTDLFVVINPKQYSHLEERLCLEIERGHFHDVFSNRFIGDKKFQAHFIQYMGNLSNEKLAHIFLQTRMDYNGIDDIDERSIQLSQTLLLLGSNCKALHWLLGKNIQLLCEFVFERLKEVLSKQGESLIPIACLGGNIDTVTQLLDDGKFGTVKDTWDIERGCPVSVLHMAAVSGSSVLVQLILDKVKTDVNIGAFGNTTPLLVASLCGHYEVVNVLLKHDANINKSNQTGRSSLFVASASGHCDVVKLLLEHKADVNQNNNVGNTALLAASINGHCDIVKLLLEHKADINQSNNDGITPLRTASGNGQCDVVKLLLEHKADVNQSDNQDNSPMHVASVNGHCDVVKLLLEYKAALNQSNNDDITPLRAASGNGHCDVVKLLVEHKADVNQSDNDGYTPLCAASAEGHCDVVKLLLEHKADVNQSNTDGITPLLAASAEGHCDVVKILVEHKADVNQSDNDGNTPLRAASAVDHCDVVKLLLEHKAALNQSDNDGNTPLHAASGNGHCDVVKLLLEHKADVNQNNNVGNTPLYAASANGHCDVVKLLLEHKAALNQSDNDGNTPLTAASGNGHFDVVKLLLEHKADVKQSNNNGITPLYAASVNGHCDVVKLLLEHKADVKQSNNNGITPLYVASVNGHCDVVKLLLEHKAAVNRIDINGNTPLYVACVFDHCDVVQLLLQHLADVNLTNKIGTTPLCVASVNGNCEIAILLLQHSADVNQSSTNGTTPLCAASSKGHCEIVRLLLEKGANVSLCVKSGDTPIALATKNAHHKVVALLSRYQ